MPEPLVVSGFAIDVTGEHAEVSCRVRDDAGAIPNRLWFRLPSELAARIEVTADPFAALLLLPAMRGARGLEVEAPVSRELAEGFERIMGRFAEWGERHGDGLERARIRAENAVRSRRGDESAAFFSAGIDSFYTVLRNDARHPARDPRRISHLILLKGFDVGLDDDVAFRRVREAASGCATELGRTLVTVETNARMAVREFDWDRYGHGTVLAATGLVLSPLFATIFVPSSGLPPTAMTANAVHPSVVPWWSNESTEFVSDGGWATRSQKTRLVARSALALAHLRVCWERTASYNCGRCEKCLRTMVDLHVAGALPSCGSLPKTVDVSALGELSIPELDIPFWQEALAELGPSEMDRSIASAIEDALWRGSWTSSTLGSLDLVASRALAQVGLGPTRLKELDDRLFRGRVRQALRGLRGGAWRRKLRSKSE